MNVLTHVYILNKIWLKQTFRGPSSWLIYLLFVCISFIFQWDEKYNSLRAFGSLLEYDDPRSTVLKVLFHRTFINFWVIFLFFFWIPKIQFKLANSFSISQTLWLKLNRTSHLSLALSRVVFLLWVAGSFALLSVFWSFLFSTYHQLTISSFQPSILGFLGFLLLSGSLTLTFTSFHRLSRDMSLVLATTFSFFPILLGFFKEHTKKIWTYFPHNQPILNFEEISPSIVRSYESSIWVAFVLLGIYLVKNSILELIYSKVR